MDEPRLLSRGFVLANLANLTFFTGVTTFFVLPIHLEALGATRADVGHVMGSFGVTSVLAIPATGALIDRFGRKPFMLAGALFWGLSALAFSQVERFGASLYLLRMAQGASFSLAFVATNALAVEYAPAGAIGRAIAIFGTTTLVTHALGPTLGELMLGTVGFRTLCFASAGSAVAAMAVILAIDEPSRPPPSVGRSTTAGFGLLLRRPGAKGALFAGLTSALAFGAAMNFMPIFVRARGLSSVSPFFTGYVLSAILVRVVSGGLGDRLGHGRVGAAALTAFALVVGAFAFIHGKVLLVVLALAFGVAHGWTYPSLNALFLGGASASARGRAMALFNLSFNAGVTLAAFTGGEVAERFGYSAMWVLMAALPLLGVGGLLVDRSAEPGPLPD